MAETAVVAAGRTIGVRHRVKKTTRGEAHPTRVAIRDASGKVVEYDLDDDQAEIDFVWGRFPVEYRAIEDGDDVGLFRPYHLRTRRLKKDERSEHFPALRLIEIDGELRIVTHVPACFDGMSQGDTIVSVMGGSGGMFLAALSKVSERRELGATVWGIPPFSFASRFPESEKRDKERDQVELLAVWDEAPDQFLKLDAYGRHVVRIREAFIYRQHCQGDRIACGQRVLSRARYSVYLTDEAGYPDGAVREIYRAAVANDNIHKGLLAREEKADRELVKALAGFPLWEKVLSNFEGCGPTIAAGLIASLLDIRRFYRPGESAKKTADRVVAYLGVHVLLKDDAGESLPTDRQFPRQRAGSPANWDEEKGRQSLYQLANQFNYQPHSEWGKKLRVTKVRFRERHPEPVVVERKGRKVKRYTDGHILKMAKWRTLTKFVRWMVKEWLRLEGLLVSDEARKGQASAV